MNATAYGTFIALRGIYETLLISAPTVADAFLARMTVARGDARLARWSRRLLAQAGVDLRVVGREHVDPTRPYVVMSNHQSHYDIPVMFQAFPGTLRMVAKTELFRVPIWGAAMAAAGFIQVDRSDRARAVASLNVAKQSLAGGISVWIAPEGTRSRTGELLPFKKGGFVLARETGLAIVPVGIVGTRAVLAAHGAVVHPGARVHVSIEPPIPVASDDESPEARDALIAAVRAAITRGVARGESALATPGPTVLE